MTSALLTRLGIRTKRDFRRWALKHHPDRNPHGDLAFFQTVCSEVNRVFDGRGGDNDDDDKSGRAHSPPKYTSTRSSPPRTRRRTYTYSSKENASFFRSHKGAEEVLKNVFFNTVGSDSADEGESAADDDDDDMFPEKPRCDPPRPKTYRGRYTETHCPPPEQTWSTSHSRFASMPKHASRANPTSSRPAPAPPQPPKPPSPPPKPKAPELDPKCCEFLLSYKGEAILRQCKASKVAQKRYCHNHLMRMELEGKPC